MISSAPNKTVEESEEVLEEEQSKTGACGCHINNRKVYQQLQIPTEGVLVQPVSWPTFLGVALDRSLLVQKLAGTG